jgi:hypothetical protein
MLHKLQGRIKFEGVQEGILSQGIAKEFAGPNIRNHKGN